jgi:allantoin racemase
MKKILVINPNSSEKMTLDIKNTINDLKIPDIEITVINNQKAPEVLESFTDYTIASYETIEKIKQISDYDAVLLACFGDPGIYSLKEITKVPIIGIGEASFALAQLLGYKFSIISASSKAKPMMDQMILSYGLDKRLASVETLNLPIENFLHNKELLLEKVLIKCEDAINNGADVIIFGCAGMTVLGDEVEKILGVTVIDPIKAGIVFLDAILNGDFKISKSGLYENYQK